MSREWIALTDATPYFVDEDKEIAWRTEVLRCLHGGLLPAFASRFTLTNVQCPIIVGDLPAGHCKCLVKAKNPSSPGHIEDEVDIQPAFWRPLEATVGIDGWKTTSTCEFAFCDWNMGNFASLVNESEVYPELYRGDADDEPGSSDQEKSKPWKVIRWVIGVHVDFRIISRLSSRYKEVQRNYRPSVPKQNQTRKSKYDWPAALVHLIALAELEGLVSDPDEHGAQAKIERALADWFASSGNDIPSEAAIRPYAAKVLAAIKAQGQKAS